MKELKVGIWMVVCSFISANHINLLTVGKVVGVNQTKA